MEKKWLKDKTVRALWMAYLASVFFYLIYTTISQHLNAIYFFERVVVFFPAIKIIPLIILFYFLLLEKKKPVFLWKLISLFYSLLVLIVPYHLILIVNFLFPQKEASLPSMNDVLESSATSIERILLLPALLLIIHFSFSKKAPAIFSKAMQIVLLVCVTLFIPLFIKHQIEEQSFSQSYPEIRNPLRKFILDCGTGRVAQFMSEEPYKTLFEGKTLSEFIQESCDCFSQKISANNILEEKNEEVSNFLQKSLLMSNYLDSSEGKEIILDCVEKTGALKNIRK